MFQRSIAPLLNSTIESFRSFSLTGPRQSGKTTLLKQQFPNFRYINLEYPDELLTIQQDPKTYLSQYPDGLIIDEAQNFPPLFSYLQTFIDETQNKYILSGSQHFLLNEKITQSLAGRTAVFDLLPLTFNEYLTNPNMPPQTIWSYLYQGSYPKPYQEGIDISLWANTYIRTYVERDVRDIMNVRDLAKFQLFLRLCASRHGQLLNLTNIAQNCGISHTTAEQWLHILEISYIVFRLRPYYENFNKRLIKQPKLYFYDSGLVCHLLGIETPDHLMWHSSRGAVFEGFVLSEIIKLFFTKGRRPELYFWKSHRDDEVDGIIKLGETLIALEIKAGATITDDYFKQLQKWQRISQQPIQQSYLIYAGEKATEVNGIAVIPWQEIDNWLNTLLC